jgi:hypothetical protein
MAEYTGKWDEVENDLYGKYLLSNDNIGIKIVANTLLKIEIVLI